MAFYMFFRLNLSKIKNKSSFLAGLAAYKWIILGIVLAVAVVFCVFLVSRAGRQKLQKLCSLINLNLKKTFFRLREAAKLYRSKPIAIVTVFLLTFFVQILSITGFWLLGLNMGIDISIKYYYVFFTLTWALGALPVSIGGAVVIEGSLVILFTKFAGLEESAAWAIALSQRAIWMITSLPGAVIHLTGIHLPKEIFVDSEEPIE